MTLSLPEPSLVSYAPLQVRARLTTQDMSDKESDHEMPDAELGSSNGDPDAKTVDFGELKVSGNADVAAGVAAGNIHLQSANAATLALPEVRSSRRSEDAVQHNVPECCKVYKLISG